jgi:hypothetical protein
VALRSWSGVDHQLTRGDVITILDGLMQEGVITSARARVSAKPADRPEITVPQEIAVAEALREVRSALEPLGLDLLVVVRLGGSAGESL